MADADTEVTLVNSTIGNTLPDGNGDFGYGIQVSGGAALEVVGCEVYGNKQVGLLAQDPGTQVVIHDSSVTGTVVGTRIEEGATAVGITSQSGASLSASGLSVEDNEGPGLYGYGEGAHLECFGCSLYGNGFAGTVVVNDGNMVIQDSIISGTREGANLGGGVGIYAAQQQDWGPPSLLVTDTAISDNLVAGAWFAGEGSYRLSGNTIIDGNGVTHGTTTRCGDGVFATGTTVWDGSSGLVLAGNEIFDNMGAGLFLDDAAALLEGNTWLGNAPDLLVQGEACLLPQEDWADAPNSEICPTWDRPTCELAFRLNLVVVDFENAMPPPSAAFPFPPRREHPAAREPPRLLSSQPLHLLPLQVEAPRTRVEVAM